MKVPSTTCVPVSRMKLRSSREPYCWLARVNVTVVIENVSAATETMEAAITPSTSLPG